jgi:hypothetical protein
MAIYVLTCRKIQTNKQTYFTTFDVRYYFPDVCLLIFLDIRDSFQFCRAIKYDKQDQQRNVAFKVGFLSSFLIKRN